MHQDIGPASGDGKFFVLLALGAVLALPHFGSARPAPGEICDRAAQSVSLESDVPLVVLRAITRTETGRRHGESMRPWPWTINMQGTGIWFDTEDQARVYVFRHFKNGARSFDVGCFQINYKWHGQAFNSIDDMFDPLKNARYAASYLKKLHGELGSWDKAVGAYHSRTQKHAERYLARYTEIRDSLSEEPPIHRPRGFTLLQGLPATSRRGSLVPLGPSTGRNILVRRGN